MKFKGITFIHTTEFQAQNYLKENSYYYKVTSYRKNFIKDNNGKYQYLDFANLTDIATIDMHLRYLLIKLSLDVEHAIKTLLVHLITESDEDGYRIVEEYSSYQYDGIAKNPKNDQETTRRLQENYTHSALKILEDSKNPKGYHKDLYDKRKVNPSIWVLIELMSYGQLASFIKFYVDKKKFWYKSLSTANDFMYLSKNVRDCAAHNRPLQLLDICCI